MLVGRQSSELARVKTQLTETGYGTVTVLDDESALNLIDPGQFSAVIIDGAVPSDSVLKLTDYTAHIAPSTLVIEDPMIDRLHHLLEG